jgi:hydroxymethylbilane synthase
LEETLRGLLPGDTTLILRADGSTDSVERLRDFLVSNDFDGTIVPQWLLGEISRATFPDRFLADGIASLRRMVLPLSRHTPAPGQGVVLFDSPISNLDDPAHCPETERACLREAASVSAGDPPTILSRSFGTVVFGDRDSSGLRRLSIESVAPALPKALSRDVVWPPENGSSEAITRTPLPLPPIEISPEIGFIVSKAEAWPASFVVPDTTVVLVPGDASWCKLSAQGIFVGGSFDSLGEGELTSLKAAFPRVRRWMKLGHSEGVETAEVTLIPTYRVAASSEAPQLNGFTHFFWRSGSQFERYLAANPQLLSCFHGSGPGHTAATIRRRIPNPAQSSVYGSFEDFIHQVI